MVSLDWTPALDHPELLAPNVLIAVRSWAEQAANVASEVLVAAIDPDLADTQALTDAYGLDLAISANCVVVAGKRAGDEKVAAAVVRATTRADVNGRVKSLLDVRKASFLPTDRAVAESGMEYGGITPTGLPPEWPILVDSRVVEQPAIVIGSGVRRSKIVLPGASLGRYPGVHVIEGLANPV